MVITDVTSDCITLRLTSTLLDDWIALDGDPDQPTLTLTYTYNCGDDTSLTVDNTTVDLINGWMDLTKDELGSDDDTTIRNGIFFFTLKSVDPVTTDISYEYLCYFVNCSVACDIIEYLGSNLDSPIYAYYQVLTHLNTCTECPCSYACTIYDYMVALLQEENTSDCGCQ